MPLEGRPPWRPLSRVLCRWIIISALVACFLPIAALAESWTNAAGRAIEARLLRLEGSVAVFQPANGPEELRIPLASLARSEQERARRLLGDVDIPPALRAEFAQCQRLLRRLRQLHSAGDLSGDEYADRRRKALESFRHAMQREAADPMLINTLLSKVASE